MKISIQRKQPSDAGFSLLEVVVVVAIVVILASFAFMRVARARETVRLSGVARVLAAHLEKARLDAIRRHEWASVTINPDKASYNVEMDFTGNGTRTVRTFQFGQGITIAGNVPPPAKFDWRGRITESLITIPLQNTGGATNIDVGCSGDITLDSGFVTADVAELNNGTLTNANVDINAGVGAGNYVVGATVRSNTKTNCENEDGGTGTPGVGGSVPGSNCTTEYGSSPVYVKKNGGSTATITIKTKPGPNPAPAGTVTASYDTTHLNVAPNSQPIAANGSVSFIVKSKSNTRGTFSVSFTTPCSTAVIQVKVTK